MATNIRIPKAEITGIYGGIVKIITRRMFGHVPESVGVMWHHPAVFKDMMGMGRKAEKWDRVDPNLASFAAMAAAGAIGCSFCLDLHYFMAHNKGLDEARAWEVPRWRESDAFTPLERSVMEYAEAMSQTPPTVTDELSGALLEQLGAAALVELTARVALMNCSAPGQHCIRHPFGRVLGGLWPAAPRNAILRRFLLGMSDDPFVNHRGLLFTVAYEMLGSATDAEDVVQETWLRWAAIGDAARAELHDPRAYLVRMITRQALNRLRTLARQREEYVGAWLPEPVLTSPDVADDVELAESVSMAMLTVLETLGSAERAVFVLHEVFDVPYDEIAEAVDKSPAAVRQIAHRARGHVSARRPRMQVSHTEQQQVVERFFAALTTGDVHGLMNVLAPDVVMVSDGGGLVPAFRHPVEGRERAVALLSRIAQVAPNVKVVPLLLNGGAAARLDPSGEMDTVFTFLVEDGRIARVYAMRNPHKLGRLEEVADLRR